MLLETVFSLLFNFKPVHVMNTPERSCGAVPRLMKETVKVYTAPGRELKINGMPWENMHQDEDGDFVARYQVRPDQYTYLQLTYNTGGAYLELVSIDEKRRPCRDMIYLKRVR